jgi:signal transduction histidine kinase
MVDASHTLHTRQLDVLREVAELVATLDLDNALLQSVKLTTDVVGATKGSVFLLDKQGNNIQRFLAARDMDPEKKQIVGHLVLEKGLAGWALDQRQAALIYDTAQDSRWLILDDDLRVRSAICVPFLLEDQVRGVLTLEHPEPHHFTPDDMRLAETVAHLAGVALHNAELFESVQAQQRELTAVLSSISEAVLVIDHQWRIRLINTVARDLLQINANTPDRLNEIPNNPLVSRLVEAVNNIGDLHSLHLFELHDDGLNRDFLVNLAALETPEAKDYVIALYDVTSMKDLDRLKTHMIRMASHDLKNPLALMAGYLDLVREDAHNDQVPSPAYLDGLFKAVERMEQMIASLLEIRNEQDLLMQRSPINPAELARAVLEDMTPVAAQHEHKIVTDIRADLPTIKGDFVQLRQAIENLFSNAIKYTPDGGTITLNIYLEDERLYFSVQDTGYGIPEDQQQFVFQPHFRANQPEIKHIEGSGVGLSLVREVVNRHGGNVWFTSQQGVSSTFGFWLPLL